MARKNKRSNGLPLSENPRKRHPEATREECIEDLKRVQHELFGDSLSRVVSRNAYREHGEYSDSTWSFYFGSFTEFRRHAKIFLSRPQQQLEREVAKHASVDHYREKNSERKDWGDKYIRKNKKRDQLILGISDVHDIMVDRFWLRVVLETAKRAQPDIICIDGDLFDCPEFGKYDVDPREWGVVERISFVHEEVLHPLRKACPKAQIDLIEGNHEARLVKHLADATPAMRAVLSDLHGWELQDLFLLKDLEINYIAEANLAAWTKRDFKKELSKNYKIYYDCVVAHHYPEGRTFGMPGFHGHHHKHELWQAYSPVWGPYEWHQLGCGHMRSASYTDGLKWANGFILAHVDTKEKEVNFEYVPVTNKAIVGGKYYYRSDSERYLKGHK